MTHNQQNRSITEHAAHLASKVPEATLYFWITKILTTGMGETTSDYLANHFDPVVAGVIALIGLVVAFVLQFTAKKYVAWIYWFVVVMVSIFGTMVADVIHVVLAVPYIVSTISFAVILAVIFIIWYRMEKTLSIHSIYTKRREVFYWLTVLFTFALGTATGDLTAGTLHLGYLTSGVLFTIIFAIPALAYWLFDINAIFAFWFAYVITRPLGASFADWMGVPHDRSGLGWGTGPVSLALGIIILGFVGYLAISKKDIERHVEK